jgi:hypothetical protein
MAAPAFAHTRYGNLRIVDRHDDPIRRVGYRPDPWTWTPWEYAGSDGRFHGRYDDPHGTWRTLYAGFSALACYLEVLAAFRPDPVLTEALDAIADEDADEFPTAAAGTVPRSWCAPRMIASGRLTGTFAVPGHPESLPTLRQRFLGKARDLGLSDLDAAAIRDSRPRALTQAISAWLYTVTVGDEHSSLTGIEFLSRHGDNLTLWAFYERDTASSTPPAVVPAGADLIDPNDPDLKEAMRLHRLAWAD